MSDSPFAVGQRVIVTDAEPEFNGYYGHVTLARTDKPPSTVIVLFQGRVGSPASPHVIGHELGMFANELQHAD